MLLSLVLVLVSSSVNLILATSSVHNQLKNYEETSPQPIDYTKECVTNYSLACLKADIVRLISLISKSPPIQVLPGISLSSSGIRPSLSGLNQRTADDILAKALTDFFRSITIHISLYNERASELFSHNDSSPFTARLKKYKFLSVYTVFAIAFALLSALVGKAMTLSIVSLIISMIARNGGNIGNSPANSPTQVYDIVRRPHIQFANTHSTEEIFEGARKMEPFAHDYSKIYAVKADPYTAYVNLEKNKKYLRQNLTKMEE